MSGRPPLPPKKKYLLEFQRKQKEGTSTLFSSQQITSSAISPSLLSNQVDKSTLDHGFVNNEDLDSSIKRFKKLDSDYSHYLMVRHFEGNLIDPKNVKEESPIHYSTGVDEVHRYANMMVGLEVGDDKSKGKKPINASDAKGKRKRT